MLKRYSSSVELLPHDVVELILERLPVKSLLRFRSVSKTWKLTIEDRRFQERQLIHRSKSRGPDILFVHDHLREGLKIDAGKLVFDSSIDYNIICFPTRCNTVCPCICDGLVCFYSFYNPSVSLVVVNPATRWHQTLPLSRTQLLLIDRSENGPLDYPIPRLGFGKDKVKGAYKTVYLYNSSEFGLDNVTTCEVFDFSTNVWRYVHPAAPYRINVYYEPVYLDGSLYWFTECEETKVLSFDLHTETFQVICKPPFTHAHDHTLFVSMCVLDNCLCVSKKKLTTQEIWSLDSSGGNIKTWKKMCSIDLNKTPGGRRHRLFVAMAVLEKNKLLVRGRGRRGRIERLVIHDLHTKSYKLLSKTNYPVVSVCYSQSLFSALPN